MYKAVKSVFTCAPCSSSRTYCFKLRRVNGLYIGFAQWGGRTEWIDPLAAGRRPNLQGVRLPPPPPLSFSSTDATTTKTTVASRNHYQSVFPYVRSKIALIRINIILLVIAFFFHDSDNIPTIIIRL